MWSERHGNEVYVFWNGELAYKRWLDDRGLKKHASMLANKGWPSVRIVSQGGEMITGEEIAARAWEAFDAWCAAHDDEIADMDLLERIEVYSNDCAWHSRETQSR